MRAFIHLASLEKQAALLTNTYFGYLLNSFYNFQTEKPYLLTFSELTSLLSNYIPCASQMLDVLCIPALYNLMKLNLDDPNLMANILTTFGNLASLPWGKESIEEFDVIYLTRNCSKKFSGAIAFESVCDLKYILLICRQGIFS